MSQPGGEGVAGVQVLHPTDCWADWASRWKPRRCPRKLHLAWVSRIFAKGLDCLSLGCFRYQGQGSWCWPWPLLTPSCPSENLWGLELHEAGAGKSQTSCSPQWRAWTPGEGPQPQLKQIVGPPRIHFIMASGRSGGHSSDRVPFQMDSEGGRARSPRASSPSLTPCCCSAA